MPKRQSQRVLGTFTLAMLSVSAILNLRNIPFMASLGLESIFFYAMAAFAFLIPSAFVCAELATRFPNNGGVYSWVKQAWGKKIGFIAIWIEWVNNIIGFPATLSTIVATIAYLGFPALAQNKYWLFLTMMLIFWGATLFNFLHIKTSTKLNVFGALFGTILPGSLIIILGIIWFAFTKNIAISATSSHIIPSFSSGSMVFFVGTLSGYSGMQILAFHASNVKNPNRTFPRAILFSGILIFTISVLAALSLAIVVPKHELNIMNGVIEGFSIFFQYFHIAWLTPLMALSLVIGSIATLSAWMLGPTRALLIASEDKILPKLFCKKNKNNMPIAILLIQAIIGTILASLFLFMPSIQSAFWMLIALTSQFTVMMFIMVFISALKLSYQKTKFNKNVFNIPGGKATLWLFCLLGISACSIGFVLGLFPPDLASTELTAWQYSGLMVVGDAIIIGLPLLWLIIKKNQLVKLTTEISQ